MPKTWARIPREKTTDSITKTMKNSVITQCLTTLAAGVFAFTTIATAEEPSGAIYTMDNAAGANRVLAWRRAGNGSLAGAGTFATGGAGTGAGLSSQGSVLLTRDGHWLVVCNTGSDDLSLFAVSDQGLQLVDRVSSQGRSPVSLTLYRNVLYALNAGGALGDKDNIAAFLLADGHLAPIPDSRRALSGDNTGPAQVSFTDDGSTLIVTERTTSVIDTFALDEGGLAANRKGFQSAGATPFGFAVGRRNRLFVSEAGASTVSSYAVSGAGNLEIISASVPTDQSAACWLISSLDQRFIYTANAGSGSLSGFAVGSDGSIHALNPSGRTADTGAGSHPVDMSLSNDGRFLFTLANGNGTLLGFRTRPDGSLQPVAGINGLPTSTAGLAGR
jgi:6-phosphogluconolactonase